MGGWQTFMENEKLNRADIKALDPAVTSIAYLEEGGRSGQFVFKPGSYASKITADPLEGLFLQSDIVAATSGAWVREEGGQSGEMSIEWWGAVAGNPSIDTTPALNAVGQIAVANNRVGLRFSGRGGNYFFNTKPATMPRGIIISGEGISLSGLLRNYQPANNNEHFLHWDGSNCNGAELRDISVVAYSGTGGNLVSLTSPLGSALSYFSIAHAYVSYAGSGYATRCVSIEGRANDGTSGGQGVRDVNINDSYLFCHPSGAYCLEARNLVVGRVNNLYTQTGQVVISGGGTAGTNSIDVKMSNLNAASMTIEKSSGVMAIGVASGVVSIQSTATNGMFIGRSPSLSNGSSSFHVINGGP